MSNKIDISSAASPFIPLLRPHTSYTFPAMRTSTEENSHDPARCHVNKASADRGGHACCDITSPLAINVCGRAKAAPPKPCALLFSLVSFEGRINRENFRQNAPSIAHASKQGSLSVRHTSLKKWRKLTLTCKTWRHSRAACASTTIAKVHDCSRLACSSLSR